MIILGLGNPGPRYISTRHNAGFLVLDAVARMVGVSFTRGWFRPYDRASWGCHLLVKPRTYMNRSGDVLPRLMRRTGCAVADLVVVHDNVDLPPGTCKVKTRGTGGGGHRGLESIQSVLGTTEFRRVAVGVGRPAPGGQLAAHVLSEPSPGEIGAFSEGVDRAARAVIQALRGNGAREEP